MFPNQESQSDPWLVHSNFDSAFSKTTQNSLRAGLHPGALSALACCHFEHIHLRFKLVDRRSPLWPDELLNFMSHLREMSSHVFWQHKKPLHQPTSVSKTPKPRCDRHAKHELWSRNQSSDRLMYARYCSCLFCVTSYRHRGHAWPTRVSSGEHIYFASLFRYSQIVWKDGSLIRGALKRTADIQGLFILTPI